MSTSDSSASLRYSGIDARAPEHPHRGLALAVISMAQLMVILDVSVVNVALPSIQKSLHFSSVNLEWIVNGYTLAFGGLLLLGGRLGDLFGRRRMFIIGVSLFTCSSLFGGFAIDQGWLIASRVMQGLGGAIAAPTALSLITSTFEEGPERNRAMGVYAAMSGAGGAIGSILGGVLTSELNWRWVLFINVPLGLGVISMAPRVLAETDTQEGRLDLPGAISASLGMTMLVYGLAHAANHPWTSAGTIGPMVVGVALLVGFVLIERRSENALMPLHIFASRDRSGAYGVAVITAAGLFSMFFFATLFMQNILGFSALQAGLGFLPFALALILSAGMASQVLTIVSSRVPITFGLLASAGGLYWLSEIGPSSSYAGALLGPLMLMAVGLGFVFVPLTLAAVSAVRRDEAGIASAVLNASQQVGGALGLAVLGTVAATITGRALSRDFGKHIPNISPNHHLAPGQRALVNHAVTNGYVAGFHVATAMVLGAFVLGVITIRLNTTAQTDQDLAEVSS